MGLRESKVRRVRKILFDSKAAISQIYEDKDKSLSVLIGDKPGLLSSPSRTSCLSVTRTELIIITAAYMF